MSNRMTSPHLPVLVLVSCLVIMAETMTHSTKVKQVPSKKWINCTRYVFHPVCRGIAAKRSSGLSSSSSSSSSRLFRPMSDDLDRTDFLSKILYSTHKNGDSIEDVPLAGLVPSSLQQHQQQNQQQPAYPYTATTKDSEWRRQLLRVLLKELGSREYDPQEAYAFYSGLDNDST